MEESLNNFAEVMKEIVCKFIEIVKGIFKRIVSWAKEIFNSVDYNKYIKYKKQLRIEKYYMPKEKLSMENKE